MSEWFALMSEWGSQLSFFPWAVAGFIILAYLVMRKDYQLQVRRKPFEMTLEPANAHRSAKIGVGGRQSGRPERSTPSRARKPNQAALRGLGRPSGRR